MSGEVPKRSFTPLLQEADATTNRHYHARAATALREATLIKPNEEEILDSIQQLSVENGLDAEASLVQFCREYLEFGQEQTLQKLAAALPRAPEHQTIDAWDYVLALEKESRERKEQLARTLFSRLSGSRHMATMLASRPTETFNKVWSLGNAGIDLLAAACLLPDAWTSIETRGKASRDLFVLLLATLLEPAHETYESCMRAMARLMAVNGEGLDDLIDADNLNIILSFLSVETSPNLRSQATLLIAKFLAVSKHRGESLLRDYIFAHTAKHTNDDMVAAFSVASSVFPIIPSPASAMFLSSGFVESLTAMLAKSKSARFRKAALELLSAACVSKDCRGVIRKDVAGWLWDVVKTENSDESLIAALVLSKIQGDADKTTSHVLSGDSVLYDTLIASAISNDDAHMHMTVEGLAYLSILPEYKERIVEDSKLVDALIRAVTDATEQQPAVFGVLSIFANIATYQVILSEEQSKVAQLKAYANQSTPLSISPLDDNVHVTKRCKKLLDSGIVSAVLKASRAASPTIACLVAVIVCNLAKAREHAGLLIQNGALDILFALVRLDNRSFSEAKAVAAHAMARLLTPIDPSLVFSNQSKLQSRSVTDVARALNDVLARTDNEDLRPAFEALQALTNIASLSLEASTQITLICFDTIESYLASSRSAVRQAATECIGNLSVCDQCIAKFVVEGHPSFPKIFDGVKELERPRELRFLRLRDLADDDARGTRHAGMAAMFNVTQTWQGVRMLQSCPSSLEWLVDHVKHPHQHNGKPDIDMLMRTLGVLCNVLQTEENIEATKTELKSLRLAEALQALPEARKGQVLYDFVHEARQRLV